MRSNLTRVSLLPGGDLCRGFALGAGLLVLGTRALVGGEIPPPVAPKPETITSIRQFWNLTAEEKGRSHPFRIECDVTFYDPLWKNLWIQDQSEGAYVALGERLPPVANGQHILINGTLTPPNADISFEHATITVLSTSTIQAMPVDGKIMQTELLQNRFVSLEAFVDQQTSFDPAHLHLTLSVEGHMIFAWILLDPTKPVPQLTDSIVRIHGVYNPKVTPAGQMSTLEIMSARIEDCEVIGRLDHDPRFAQPAVTIESLAHRPFDGLVKIVGQVKGQEPGRYLRIRDDTGQIDLITGQTRPCSINERVEAVGYPAINGTEWRLEGALFRSAIAPPPAPTGQSLLHVAAQVLELTPEEAGRGQPVRLTGVVTWSHPDSPYFFIQDASGGVCIQRGTDRSRLRPPGRNVEVHGATAMGAFAPLVVASESIKLGDLVLPEARQVSLEHALTGAEEAQWVEMRGYLRQIQHDGPWLQAELTTAAGSFFAMLPGSEDLSPLLGAVVRLHGVCTATANERRKLTGIQLWVPSAAFVQVEEAAPADPFDVPARSLANLGQFGTLRSFNRRVKVSGVVLYHSPGHFFYIEDGGQSLLVMSRQTSLLAPGDQADAAGFLGRQGDRVVLREADYRKTGLGHEPVAHHLERPAELLPALDGQLVQVEARLIEISPVADQTRLSLQTENAIFEAYLDGPDTGKVAPAWVLGSDLSLTGVYESKYDEYGHAGGFQLRLRSPRDVVVIGRPSWLTRGRIMAFAGALALGILLFIAWVVALRRRVRKQTGQIREQLKRESRLEAELQRASKLESLGILAGGIAHDFNNLLTVVMGNLSLARLDPKLDAESSECLGDAERAVARAKDLTHQLLTFARGGAPIRAAVMLADVVREVAEFALHGSAVDCLFDLAPDLWPADVDKGQIGQVVQNVVINAMQSMPKGGTIDISLRNEEVGPEAGQVFAPGRYLKLTITDHGAGISAGDLPKIFDPYFTTKKQGNGLGLATVHSIVKKHLGHISVESQPGRGTSFHIWLPAAVSVAEAAAPADDDARSLPREGSGRILFMDDEADIRRLGLSMLRRFGYDATVVNDGAEAVQAYTRARRENSPFDLVILDLTVPGGVGGREAMTQLLELDPGVKAIVSSGYSNDQVLANYRAHGFRGMVSKPYEIADLAHTIKSVLNGEHA